MNEINELIKKFTNTNADPSVEGKKPVILIIDEDASMKSSFQRTFDHKYHVITARNEAEGVSLLTPETQCVILEIKKNEMPGWAIFPELQEKCADVPIIFYACSQLEDERIQDIIKKYSPQGYARKGRDFTCLNSLIESSITNYKLSQAVTEIRQSLTADLEKTKAENFLLRREREHRYRFDQLKGNCEAFQRTLQLCKRASNSDITVLLEGETGTGKEIVARMIHMNSTRREKIFVAQNCAAIPDELLASELFGYKKGAFTGAYKDNKGLFEIADGGTLLLDEVGDMSATMQVNLLRALQEGEFKPLGGNEYKPFDVRIISATNKDLKHQVKIGLFREDLFFRLSAFPILLPPLRERKDDIPLLIRHIMAKSAKKFQNTIGKINPKAMLLLMEYSFPGNVRELENIIERAMAMADDGDRIEPHHLPRDIRHIDVLDGLLPEQSGTLKEMVTALEKTILLTTLKKKNWIKAQAAQELGLSRLGLRKKMQRYNITPG